MVNALTAYALLWLLVGAERGYELWLSARNARWAKERGGVEEGAGHYPAMVLLHLLMPAACFAEVILLDRSAQGITAAVAVAVIGFSMALRYWAIHTLGPYWNTRVIVVPNAPPVATGPYRWVRHPNYVAVMFETLALPLAHSAWVTALIFTALQIQMLRVRIRSEEAALERHCGYGTTLGSTPRFVPHRSRGRR